VEYSDAMVSFRRAFTLIELLVTIGVMALLISLLLPALGGAMVASRRTAVLSNLRQTALTFDKYISTFGSTYPWAPAGTRFQLFPPGSVGGGWISDGYWMVNRHWPSLFHKIAPWPEHFSVWVEPKVGEPGKPWLRGTGSTSDGYPSFWMSDTLYARPEVWTRDVLSPVQMKPVRTDDVLFPGSKVLLVDVDLTYLPWKTIEAGDPPTPVLFIDGHADVRRESEATPPPRLTVKSTRPMFDTPGGARGVDFQ